MSPVSYAAAVTDDIPKNAKRQNKFLIFLLVLIIFYPAALDYFRNRDKPIVTSVSITNITPISSTILCPGESLVFTYDLNFQGSGTLVRDLTLWNVDPPKTLIFSTARRFILPSDITQQSLVESWPVPFGYFSFETNRTEPLPSGNYHRLIAISSTTNEEVVAVGLVEFTVKSEKECPQSKGTKNAIPTLEEISQQS